MKIKVCVRWVISTQFRQKFNTGGGDSGQGEGYSGAEGPFCVQPDGRRGGRGCQYRPEVGGWWLAIQLSGPEGRGGVGWVLAEHEPI